MADQKDLDATYMGTAILHSKLSKACRAQVGAILVTRQGVTLSGYNGTAVGRPNECEVLKPQEFPREPALDHDNAFPFKSVRVTRVLLKVDWI